MICNSLRTIAVTLIVWMGVLLGTAQSASAEDGDRIQISTALDELAESIQASTVDRSDGVKAASIHRLLSQKLSTIDRFDLLKSWALPENQSSAKSVDVFCDVVAPPKEFSRLIGERPRRDVFALPSVAEHEGLFSSSWLLVDTAREVGKLRTLTDELAERDGSEAAYLMSLAAVASGRDVDRKVEHYFQAIESGLADDTTIVNLSVPRLVALVSACKSRGMHQDLIRRIESLVRNKRQLRPVFKHRVNQLSIAAKEELAPLRINEDWIAIGTKPTLFAKEHHLTHIPIGRTTYMYRYPVGGDFEFQIDVIAPNHLDQGTIGYEGHQYKLGDYWKEYSCRFGCRTENGLATFLVTGHPVAKHIQDGKSPWLSFTPGSPHETPTRYRNLTLSGSPKILPHVDLMADSMVDWIASVLPSSGGIGQWSVTNGVASRGSVAQRSWVGAIVGSFVESKSARTKSANSLPNLTHYKRPLLEKETFSYEFFASKNVMVHPALGRFAFLIGEDGVKLRWVTDDSDWTGLLQGNSIVEPLCRRGPKQLPIKLNDWNHLSMTLENQSLRLTLNNTLIYQRSTRDQQDTRFGLFSDSESSRIRNAKLTGDWPTEVDTATIASAAGPTTAESIAKWPDLFLEGDLKDNAGYVMDQARELETQQRFNFLAKWVLPNTIHNTIRMHSRFYPLHFPRKLKDGSKRERLDSPFRELLKLAKQLEKLDEIELRLSEFQPSDWQQLRAQAAALALVLEAMGKRESALSHCEKVFELNQDQQETVPSQYWPELLVAREFGSSVETSDVIGDLIQAIQPNRLNDDDAIRNELLRIRNEIRMQNDPDFRDRPDPIKLRQWIPTSRYVANRRNDGRGAANWIAFPGFVHNRGVHSSDMLIYESPLRGNFELQLESKHGGGACEVFVGGRRVQLLAHQVVLGQEGTGKKKETIPIDPPIQFEGPWVNQRYVVHDGTCQIIVNGKQVHEFDVLEDGFPWVAIHHQPWQFGGVRDVRITGHPEIPNELPLAFSHSIWRSYYEFGPKSVHFTWQLEKEHLVGNLIARTPGSAFERWLYYQRPLRDGDSIEYEYYYVPGRTEVHPALDRAAFLIQPEHVGFHRITDGWFDRTFYFKKNLEVRADEQRNAPSAFLKPNDWNKMRVDLRDGVASLLLNGHLIYQHELESENQRLFGFFHYADNRIASVRNVVLHGSWANQLPSVFEQELADPIVPELDRSRQELKSHFQHSFAKNGSPAKYFSTIGGEQGRHDHDTNSGIRITLADKSRWRQSGIKSNIKVSGDFDISAQFSDLRLVDGKRASASLIMGFATEDQMTGRVVRTDMDNRKSISGQIKTIREDGVQLFNSHKQSMNVSSAILRLARRGPKLHTLVKDETSPQFRRLKTFDIGDVAATNVELLTVGNQARHASVCWKSIDIRAERASLEGAEGDRRIFIANADGSNLRSLSPSIPNRGNHGSPEFSPDGTKVAFDTWLGTATDAHIFTINVDGTELTNLGVGTMPTYSPDGEWIYASTDDGMIRMKANDGSEREILSESGWSINVSQQGDKAAMYGYSPSRNYYVLDLKTKQQTEMMSPDLAGRYSSLYWNPDWSPDGKRLAFTARNRSTGERELVVVDSRGSRYGYEVLQVGKSLANDVTWHPDGKRIVVRHKDPIRGVGYFAVKPDDPEYDEPILRSLNLNRVGGIEWSRDGKQVVFAMYEDQVFSSSE